MDKDQIEAIKARRSWHFLAIMRSRVADGFKLSAGLWDERTREHYCNDAADLLDHIDACHQDIDALIADNERLGALEAEASVYRITVLGVNVAAGQGED